MKGNSLTAMLIVGLQVLGHTAGQACDAAPCRNGALCEARGEGYTCFCVDGYTGPTCEIDFDDCMSSPCRNNATCTDDVASYRCACAPGFTGSDCQEDIDECASSPCLQNGTCINIVNGYACECVGPFRGENCELLPCDTVPCENGGLCSDDPGFQQSLNGFVCDCQAGSAGERCEHDSSDCYNDNQTSCSGNGLCVDGINDYSCLCEPGWAGDYCESPIDDCLGNACRNDANCTDLHLGYRCECLDGYDGALCERMRDECEVYKPCQNGAVCVDLFDDYLCDCRTGWHGINCTERVDVCLTSPCLHGATCLQLTDGFTCHCAPFYTGQQCDTLYNPCDPEHNHCLNDANCVVPPDGQYRCFCAKGYTGVHCEVNVNECLSQPCENNSTCEDITSGYVCHCMQGWSGNNCEQNIDDCSPQPCYNDAECVDLLNGFMCNCTRGYTGKLCDQVKDFCREESCFNGGSCLSIPGGYECFCTQPYTGDQCQSLIDACRQDPCENNGTCLNTLNGAVCSCQHPYTGSTCDNLIDFCESEPCLNSGTCYRLVDDYKCVCPQFLTGKQCTELVDYCKDEPCKNGAYCINDASRYRCSCTYGFTGLTCTEIIDFCINKPCQNAANCSNISGGFTCDCLRGYEGDLCQNIIIIPTPAVQSSSIFSSPSADLQVPKTPSTYSTFSELLLPSFSATVISSARLVSLSSSIFSPSISMFSTRSDASDSAKSFNIYHTRTQHLFSSEVIPTSIADSVITEHLTHYSSFHSLITDSPVSILYVPDESFTTDNTYSNTFSRTPHTNNMLSASTNLHQSTGLSKYTLNSYIAPQTSSITTSFNTSLTHTFSLESSFTHSVLTSALTTTVSSKPDLPQTTLSSIVETPSLETTFILSSLYLHQTLTAQKSVSVTNTDMSGLSHASPITFSRSLMQTFAFASSLTQPALATASVTVLSSKNDFPKYTMSSVVEITSSETHLILSSLHLIQTVTHRNSVSITNTDISSVTVSKSYTHTFASSFTHTFMSTTSITASSSKYDVPKSDLTSLIAIPSSSTTLMFSSSDDVSRDVVTSIDTPSITFSILPMLSDASTWNEIVESTLTRTSYISSGLKLVSVTIENESLESDSVLATTVYKASYPSKVSMTIDSLNTMSDSPFSVSFSTLIRSSSSQPTSYTQREKLTGTLGSSKIYRTASVNRLSTFLSDTTFSSSSQPADAFRSSTTVTSGFFQVPATISFAVSTAVMDSLNYTSLSHVQSNSQELFHTSSLISLVNTKISRDFNTSLIKFDITSEIFEYTTVSYFQSPLSITTVAQSRSFLTISLSSLSTSFDSQYLASEYGTTNSELSSLSVFKLETSEQLYSSYVASTLTSLEPISPTYSVITHPLSVKPLSSSSSFSMTDLRTLSYTQKSTVTSVTNITPSLISPFYSIVKLTTSAFSFSTSPSSSISTLTSLTTNTAPVSVTLHFHSSTMTPSLYMFTTLKSSPTSNTIIPNTITNSSATPHTEEVVLSELSLWETTYIVSTKQMLNNSRFTVKTTLIDSMSSSMMSSIALSKAPAISNVNSTVLISATPTSTLPVSISTVRNIIHTTTSFLFSSFMSSSNSLIIQSSSPVESVDSSTSLISLPTTSSSPVSSTAGPRTSCDSVSCLNNGTCREDRLGVYCDCHNGYTGRRCETNTSVCDTFVCDNGGYCSVTMTTFGYQIPTCNCPLPFTGTRCNKELLVYFLSFMGISYLELPPPTFTTDQPNEINLALKTTSADGTVLYATNHNRGYNQTSYIQLRLVNGKLSYEFSCDGIIDGVIVGKRRVNTDQIVDVTIRQVWSTGPGQWCTAALAVNGEWQVSRPILSLGSPTTLGNIYLGGFPRYSFVNDVISAVHAMDGFVGCIRSLQVNQREIDMVSMATRSVNIENCNVPVCQHSPCRNGGTCFSSGEDWFCTCAYGYAGVFCERKLCHTDPCQHGGTCVIVEAQGDQLCLCPYGRGGVLCQTDLVIDVQRYTGTRYGHTSYSAYARPHYIRDSFEAKFHMVLQDNSSDSNLVMYMGNTGITGDTRDFLAVGLYRGNVVFKFDLGSGFGELYSPSPLDSSLPHHLVRLGRAGNKGWIQVDNQRNVTGKSAGPLTALNTNSMLYVGGYPHDVQGGAAMGAMFNDGLHGCIYGLQLRSYDSEFIRPGSPPGHVEEGRNVGQCTSASCQANPCHNEAECVDLGASIYCNCSNGWQGSLCLDEQTVCDVSHSCAEGSTCMPVLPSSYKCICPLGRRGITCEEGFTISDPLFADDESYMALVPVYIRRDVTVTVQLTSYSSDGLVFYVAQRLHSFAGDFLAISLYDRRVQLRFNVGSELNVIESQNRLENGTWYVIQAGRNSTHGYIAVNGHMTVAMTTGMMSYLDTTTDFYIGGVPSLSDVSPEAFENEPSGFKGCIRELVVNNRHYDLTESGSIDGRNVDDCDGTSCGYNVCKNGGTCSSDRNEEYIKCLCTEEFFGERCELPAQCRNNMCLHGNCRVINKTSHVCDCLIGWSGSSCDQDDVIGTSARLSGDGFIVIKDRKYEARNTTHFRLTLTFKTRALHALLMWHGQTYSEDEDYLGVGLHDGHVTLVWSLGWYSSGDVITSLRYNDGDWHILAIEIIVQDLVMTLDGSTYRSAVSGDFRELDTHGIYYIGGLRDESGMGLSLQFTTEPLDGCVKDVGFHGDNHVIFDDADYGINVRHCL